MSDTSRCFVRFHKSRELGQDENSWLKLLPDLIREDFHVGKWIVIDLNVLKCRPCGNKIAALSPHMVGRFLDRHNHCGKAVEAWECECGKIELADKHYCRFCETERKDSVWLISVSKVLSQVGCYRIMVGGKCGAYLEVGSLHEAMEAARAIFQYEEFMVLYSSTHAEWDSSHVCK